MADKPFANEEFYDQIHAQRRMPWLTKALEMLADGEWHERESIIKEAQKLVTPGQAVRYLDDANYHRLRREAKKELTEAEFEKWMSDPTNWAHPVPFKSWTDSEQSDYIRRGQRACAVNQISSSKRIIRKEENGKTYIKRIPMNARLLNSGANRIRSFKS